MPRDKDRKRIIRERMQKTGESYTTARSHVLSKAGPKRPSPARAMELARLAGMSDDTVAAKTGRTWQEWVRALDVDGAAALPHREIAAIVRRKHGVGDWWTQAVTVGYERIKRLRERGQGRSGEYEAGKSRTIAAPVHVVFKAWADEQIRRRWLDAARPVVRSATPPKSMRLQWPDGTRVAVAFTAKGPMKSTVSVEHTKLREKAAADAAKKYWSERLDALASMLAEASAR